MKWQIEVKEVHTALIDVEAATREEALNIVREKILDEEVESEYDYTMDEEEWDVSLISKD